MENDLIEVRYDVLDDSKLHLMHQVGGKNLMVITRGESTKHRWEWWLWKSEYQSKAEWNYSLMWQNNQRAVEGSEWTLKIE